jgi:hypothetical protein
MSWMGDDGKTEKDEWMETFDGSDQCFFNDSAMRLHIPSFLLLGVGGVNLLDGKFTFLESEMGWRSVT